MPKIGITCLLKNTDLAERIRQYIPILNLEVGARNGRPTMRAVYKELLKQTGVEIDLDTFAQYYKDNVPTEFRFTSDEEIDAIINKKTKKAFDTLLNGTVDRIDGVGETSTERAAINKAAKILSVIEGTDKSVKTKTLSKVVKDAVLASIDRLASTNPDYRASKQQKTKETYEETLQRVMETNALRTQQVEGDKFNTIQDVFENAREAVFNAVNELKDENGETLLSDEAMNFMDSYQNAFFGTMMSSADANTLVRGALIEAGYGKKQGEKTIVDWKELAGTINSPNIVRENVINALIDGKGLTEDAAVSIADALVVDFTNLVQGQKAMNAKYALAQAEANHILDVLGWDLKGNAAQHITDRIKEEVDKSVATSDEINITEIVHGILQEPEIGIPSKIIANLPDSKMVLKSHTADRIAEIIREDGEIDPDALQDLYKVLGKVVDEEAIRDLGRLARLKEQIENLELTIDGGEGEVSKMTATRQGIEKSKAIQSVSNQMARIVANSVDYSDKNIFSRFFTYGLNFLSKLIGNNAALVLLNPFNIAQNIKSGSLTNVNARIGGGFAEMFGSKKAPLTYTDDDGNKVNLTELLNTASRFETWWNTLLGAEGRDIPDLFTGDASKDTKTFEIAKSTKSKGDFVEAALTSLPRAFLTAADAMLKEPYFRKEFIRGVLYYLQTAKGLSVQEAQKLVYEALTQNSEENLFKQATAIANMVGKGKDNYYIKQVAEDIRMASLMLIDKDGKAILSSDNLQSIIDAAKQSSAEVFGHRIQKKTLGLQFVYDLFSGGKAKAVEGMNKEFGEQMAELYKRGDYLGASALHFWHTLKTAVGFLFQRGIYNWAILMAQGNPIAVVKGFHDLAKNAKTSNYSTPQGVKESTENYLRARAKIGRGIMGTITASVIVPMVLAALGGDDEERRKKLDAMKKDPVWGRLYKNFIPPFAQLAIDANTAKKDESIVAKAALDMFVKPIVSAGAKYYSTDNRLMSALENLGDGKAEKGSVILGEVLGQFLPGKSFIATNKDWWNRVVKSGPTLVEDGEIITEERKKEKKEGFWEGFVY